MPTLTEIKQPIEKELNVFQQEFRSSIKTNVPLLNTISRYMIRSKGKQMRPMFVFMSARLSGQINAQTQRTAVMIELLHTATLIHDDVVDDSNERRGYFSINALWKNKIAVLVGDFLLSRGLLIALENNDFQQLKIISRAVRDMSEGELLQIEKARKLDISEAVYFEIIRKKTASFIAACCASGISTVVDTDENIQQMYAFGEKIGIAFQIKDDLFDYSKSNKAGKPSGLDIREQKMTLPLIYTLSVVDESTRKHIISIIKNHHKDRKKINEVIHLVKTNKGLDYAEERMQAYKKGSLEILRSFENKGAIADMEKLVAYTVDRRK